MANGGPLDDIFALTPGQVAPQSPVPQEVTGNISQVPTGGGKDGGGILGTLAAIGSSGAAGPVGMAASAALGIGQIVSGIVQGGKARQMMPSGESPLLAQNLRNTSARRRSFETGAAFGSATDRFDRQSSNIIRKAAGRSGSIGELSSIINQIGAQRSDFLTSQEQQSQGAQNQLLQQENAIRTQQDQIQRSAQLLRFQEMAQRGASNVAAGTDNLTNVLAR